MRLSRHFKTISQILIFAMLHLCWLTSYGYAEMIPTESSIEKPSGGTIYQGSQQALYRRGHGVFASPF